MIRLSALQTYYSALPLTPIETKIFDGFNHDISQAPRIISSHPVWPTASVRIMEGHTSGVQNVVFSPDGRKLASASDDNTVRLWDVETGQAIGSALNNHTLPTNPNFFYNGAIINSDSPGPDSSQLAGADMSFDAMGFLQCRQKRLVWLPVTLRGCITARPPVVAVGGQSGAVTIIHFLSQHRL